MSVLTKHLLSLRTMTKKKSKGCSITDVRTLVFLEAANFIKVATSENERGVASAGGLIFAYVITRGKEAGSFVLAYLQEYTEDKRSLNYQSVIIMELDSWVILSGYENTDDQGSEFFSVAVNIALSKQYE
ncbi:hypothetical protein [Shewanella denitrificans]|uniref:hypothetical protein n=1 Tax=Shewanella denitrificans TaxID=192073 RepID=UPI00059D0173|nr:hypothetical protein [Shewanella denitrificans]